MNAINERRSIRKFKDKTLRKEDVDAVINAAILAPSAKNRQPWHYIIYSGMQKEKLLAAMEKGLIRERDIQKTLPNSSSGIPDAFYTLDVMKQAPVIIIVLNTNGSPPFEPICADDRISEMCDALSIGASIQNLLLKATELNIGSLWIANTCYAYNEIVEFIGTDYQLIGAVALGNLLTHVQEKAPILFQNTEQTRKWKSLLPAVTIVLNVQDICRKLKQNCGVLLNYG